MASGCPPSTMRRPGCSCSSRPPNSSASAAAGARASPCRPRLRIAISAGGRRLDDDGLIGVDHRRVGALQTLHLSVLAPHPVLADLTRLAAGKAERPHPAVPGQDRALHLLQKSDRAADAITGIPLSASARVLADV